MPVPNNVKTLKEHLFLLFLVQYFYYFIKYAAKRYVSSLKRYAIPKKQCMFYIIAYVSPIIKCVLNHKLCAPMNKLYVLPVHEYVPKVKLYVYFIEDYG